VRGAGEDHLALDEPEFGPQRLIESSWALLDALPPR
jgi:hypothetical protein